MSYSSNYTLNQRVSYLEYEVNQLGPIPPGGYSLSGVLGVGNSAGTYDINLNGNDLLNADAVNATSVTVTSGSETLSASNLNLNSNSRIVQQAVTTPNALSYTNVSTDAGQSSVPTMQVIDSVSANKLYVVPNSTATAYNGSVSAGDIAIVGAGNVSGTATVVFTTWSGTNVSVELSPTSALIGAGGAGVNATTRALFDGTNITFTSPNPPLSTATQPATTDNSTKMPTTAWVQSLFASVSGEIVMPYFRFSTVTNINSGRWLNPFGFSFTGSAWGVNDFFTVRLTVSCVLYSSPPVNYNLTAIFDIYPNRCPANTAYGSTSNNYTTVASSPFAQMNGSIYSGSSYYSTYNVPVDATYAPYGRYYNVSSFQMIDNLGVAQQPNCLPIYPYITQATQQTNFGFQLWSISTIAFPTNYSINCEIIGNTTNNAITSYGVTQFSNYYKTF